MNKSLSLITLLARTYHADSVLEDIYAKIEGDVDWDEVEWLIQHHRVSGLCLQTLRKIRHKAIPTSLLQNLQIRCSEATRNSLVLMNALHQLIVLIQSAGIEVACFKGVVAAQMIYGQLSIRNFSDIDLLVRKSDHQHTERLLIKNGFRITHRYDNAFQSGLRDDKRRVNVDLHWGIPPRELNLASQLLWDEISTIEVGNQSIPTFSLNDTIIITAINAVKEFWDASLYRFCDLAELIQRNPQLDWNRLFRRASQMGCKRMLYVALLVADKCLAAPLPRDVSSTLDDLDELNPIVNELIAQLENNHLISADEHFRQTQTLTSHRHFFMLMQDTQWQRLKYWLNWVTTPGTADHQFIKLPRALSLLYYVIRPFRLLLHRD